MKCECKYGTARNSKAVRRGYELSGAVIEECDACRVARLNQPTMDTLTAELLKLAVEHRMTAPDGVISALQSAMNMNERDNEDFDAYTLIWGD
jgi:hypothetical protein